MGDEVPMRERNDDSKVTGARFGRSGLAYGPRILAFLERSLEAANHVDDQVRRWLFPVTYGRGTSSPRDEVPLPRPALPSDGSTGNRYPGYFSEQIGHLTSTADPSIKRE